MVWNTIAHPKMMESPGGLGITTTYSPIKFADTHKLSFYDIIVSITGTSNNAQPILVKGDFETIKKMLLNGEAVCGAVFTYRHEENASLNKGEFASFLYDPVLDIIELQAETDSDPLYLLSDNTISETEPNGEADVPVYPGGNDALEP